LTLGIKHKFDHVLDFVRVYHEKTKRSVPIPMEEVKNGEVHENMQEGNRVNLFDFPAPLLHEKDGGRYIGTGHLVITLLSAIPSTPPAVVNDGRCMRDSRNLDEGSLISFDF
jgi:UbiD family decarboxylase